MTKELLQTNNPLTPTNFNEALKFAEMIAKSNFAPKDYMEKPGNVLVAIQMGFEVGLQPMQAIQNIAVINGRPSLWGDAMLALVMSSPRYESIEETFDEKTMTAICTVKRKGEKAYTQKFGKKDAELAGLWGRTTWKQYPKRMLQMRARGFALRDKFADVLKGLNLAEEMQDVGVRPIKNISDDPLVNAMNDVQQEAREVAHEEFDASLPHLETETKISDAQVTKIKELLQKVEVNFDSFYDYIGTDTLKDIKTEQYEEVIAMLEKKMKKSQADILAEKLSG